jgi:exodeoxyribonuclease VII large subunit
LNAESGTDLPRYDVAALNGAIGALLERGFPPRFLLEATVSRPQLKKGHLWLTLLDQTSSIAGVVWASQLPRLTYRPEDGDGVTVVGKLNFWTTRASLCVQILDVRPSLSSVLRRFERTREQLAPLGLFLPERKRPLPRLPGVVALLTSAPSSALADMLRTAAERWPACRLIVVPIPVQGAVEERIAAAIAAISHRAADLGVEALVLARGGGSREDLAVFDAEAVALALAHCPVPVVTGLGHEDDTTIADLVADYRAATPTAAIVALLPDRHGVLQGLAHHKALLAQQLQWRLQRERQRLEALRLRLEASHPNRRLTRQREQLAQLGQLLEALSPRQMLRRGFSVVRSADGRLVRSALQLNPGERIQLEFADGLVASRVIERLNRAESGSVITGSDSTPTNR